MDLGPRWESIVFLALAGVDCFGVDDLGVELFDDGGAGCCVAC